MEKPHKRLKVWEKSVDLAVKVYKLTSDYPGEEKYGLVSQMRRSAISISSNIDEGAARQSRNEYIQFLYISRGSISELDTQLEISNRLGYIKEIEKEEVFNLIEEVDKTLQGLIKKVRSEK